MGKGQVETMHEDIAKAHKRPFAATAPMLLGNMTQNKGAHALQLM